MNKLILILLYLVFFSGLMLKFTDTSYSQIILWMHLLLSFFFVAFFIVFLIDHIHRYRSQILKLTRPAVIGIVYKVFSVLAILSGIILFLYFPNNSLFWINLHFITSLFVILYSFLHK